MNRYTILGLLIVTGLIIYISKAVLLPFMMGLAIAYFLDPVADILEERKVPRGIAAALVLLLFFLIITGVLFAFWPIIKAQLSQVSTKIPETIATLGPWIDELIKSLNEKFGMELSDNTDGMVASAADKALSTLNQTVSSLLRSGMAVLNLLMLLLISPVVAFYLLRDWDLIVAQVNRLLPPAYASDIRQIMTNVDRVLAGFVRGQMLVAMCMGVMYAIGWSLIGLNFAILLGVLAGVLALIPFVGAVFAAILACLVAIGQYGFIPGEIGMVLLVYAVVQAVEGAVLTPKLVGDKVGLHPVWVLFAIFAGGEAMGFLGVLISVPVAAALAVLVRYWVTVYETHYEIGSEEMNSEAINSVKEDTKMPDAIDDLEKLSGEGPKTPS